MNKLFNITNHVLTVSITLYTTYNVFKDDVAAISLHVLLTTVGYQLLMAQAIMTFSGDNVLTNRMDKNFKINLHWILGSIGSTLAVTGSSIMFYNKSSHFTSIHGILGSIATLCILTTFLIGPLTYFKIKLKNTSLAQIKLGHFTMGTSGFILGMASLILGFQKNWFVKRTSEEIGNSIALLSFVTVLLTARPAIVKVYNTYRRLQKQN